MPRTGTATLLMQLVEQGKVSLDAPLAEFFPRAFVRKVHPRAATQTFWGHSGHFGSFMFYVPGWRATIAGTVNRAAQDNRWLFSKIVEYLHVDRD